MAKWAKSMNAQKESQSLKQRSAAAAIVQQRKESAAADAGFAMLEKIGVRPSRSFLRLILFVTGISRFTFLKLFYDHVSLVLSG